MKIIWSDIDLNIDDWCDSYAEFCELNEIPHGGDNDIYNWMIDTNNSYLDDERINLDIKIDAPIICIGDIGTWRGRFAGYVLLTNNINDIFNIKDDLMEYYADAGEIHATGIHHDGSNYYQFRAARRGRDLDKLLTAIYSGEHINPQKLNYYTRSIYPDVASVYGWEAK